MPNDNRVISKDKKNIYIGSTQSSFKKDSTIIEAVSHTKHIGAELVYLTTSGELKRI